MALESLLKRVDFDDDFSEGTSESTTEDAKEASGGAGDEDEISAYLRDFLTVPEKPKHQEKPIILEYENDPTEEEEPTTNLENSAESQNGSAEGTPDDEVNYNYRAMLDDWRKKIENDVESEDGAESEADDVLKEIAAKDPVKPEQGKGVGEFVDDSADFYTTDPNAPTDDRGYSEFNLDNFAPVRSNEEFESDPTTDGTIERRLERKAENTKNVFEILEYLFYALTVSLLMPMFIPLILELFASIFKTDFARSVAETGKGWALLTQVVAIFVAFKWDRKKSYLCMVIAPAILLVFEIILTILTKLPIW